MAKAEELFGDEILFVADSSKKQNSDWKRPLTKEQSDELTKVLSKIDDSELVGDINNKVASGKINSRNYEACKNKLTTMIGA